MQLVYGKKITLLIISFNLIVFNMLGFIVLPPIFKLFNEMRVELPLPSTLIKMLTPYGFFGISIFLSIYAYYEKKFFSNKQISLITNILIIVSFLTIFIFLSPLLFSYFGITQVI